MHRPLTGRLGSVTYATLVNVELASIAQKALYGETVLPLRQFAFFADIYMKELMAAMAPSLYLFFHIPICVVSYVLVFTLVLW